MQPVRTDDGDRYLLVERAAESSLVRDPETGTERSLPNDALTAADSATALETAAGGVPDAVRRVLLATPSERALGVLVELVDRGPLPARTLLSAYDLCESDLHGLLAEFRVAGLVAEATVDGQRGYDATATTREAVERLRD
jgi:hypothetical protein